MSIISRKEFLTINGGEAHHLKKVKEEVNGDDDEADQEEEDEDYEDEDEDYEDEDETSIPKLMSSRRKTTSYEVYDRSKAKTKRLRFSTVELENVEIGSKGVERRSSEHKNAMERAKEFEGNLNPKLPSFIKLMAPSNIKGGSGLMRVPRTFSRLHLPNHDEPMVLVGENDKEYIISFLIKHHAFCGGWVTFSCNHKLQVNDAILFQLLSRFKFKVYIFRQNVPADLHGGPLDHSAKQCNLIKAQVDKVNVRSSNEATNKNAQPNLHKEIVHDYSLSEPDTTFLGAFVESSKCRNNFVDFRRFTNTVNGVNIDSELSEDIRRKYYELCLSRKTYLHTNLLKTIKPIVAAALITEIVEIADAIRGSHLLTSQDDFVVWDKMLQSFELLGMDVEFLRSRLNHLLRLTLESKQTTEFKKCYEEAILEQTRLDEDIKTLEKKYNATRLELTRLEEYLNQLKQVKNDVEIEIHTMKEKVERYELTFQQVARAAW